VKTNTLPKNTWTKDFTISFALKLHRDALIDYYNMYKEVNWRQLFRGGLYYDYNNEKRTPLITVYRPNNTIGY